MLKLLKCSIAALALWSAPQAAAAPAKADVMIRHATIIDVERGVALRGKLLSLGEMISLRLALTGRSLARGEQSAPSMGVAALSFPAFGTCTCILVGDRLLSKRTRLCFRSTWRTA